MREIKFRAWDTQNERMVDLKKITPLALTAGLNIDGIFIPFTDDLKLMQFTGLHDANGKEIYEGDRLICTISGEPVGEPDRVQFKEGEFHLANRNRSLREWLYIEEFAGKEVECNFIVDGNIYENPDLC